MNNKVVQSPDTKPVEAGDGGQSMRGQAGVMLGLAASVRLTVVLLVLGMVLVFAGTLAQTKLGIWVVMEDYFRSLYVMIPLEIFPDLLWPSDERRYVDGPYLPFPGGFTILGLLTLNLIAALWMFVARDIKTGGRVLVRRLGLYAIHVGLIILFLGEFVTGLYAKEAMMSVTEGGWSDYVEDIRTAELVFEDRSGEGTDMHVVFPQSALVAAAKSGEPLSHPDLPVEVTLSEGDWMPNSTFAARTGDVGPLRGAAQAYRAELAPRAAGIDPSVDFPSAYLTLRDKATGQPLGTWLVTALPDGVRPGTSLVSAFPQPIGAGDTPWLMSLRFERRYLPYRVQVHEVTHETYPGTDIPRNFASTVTVVDEQSGATRDAKVWMNHPLRYGGDTYYQHQMAAAQGRTTFQVVRNVGALLPYIACVVVSVGLLWHFFMSLLGFARRSAR